MGGVGISFFKREMQLEEAHLRAQTYLRYEKSMGDKRKSDQQATRFHCQVVRKRQRKDC